MIDEVLTILFSVSILTFLPWCAIAISGRRRYPAHKSMPVSVIIPAHNEESCIESTIRSVLAARYDAPVEVIAVDDGSTDATAQILSRLSTEDPRLKTIRTDHLGKALAVNRGVEAAQNEIVVMLDADSQIEPDALHKITAPFAQPKVGAVSGIICAKVNWNPLTWYQEFEYVLSTMGRIIFDSIGCTYVVPGFAAFHKTAFMQTGGFSTDTLSEDWDIGLKMRKMGWGMVMSEARMYTTVPQTLGGIARQRMRWGRGTIQVLMKHRDMLFNRKYGLIGLYGMPNQVYFYVQGFIILPITFYQIFHGYLEYFVHWGNYLTWDVIKYFFGWMTMYGTFNFINNTLTGVWPMTFSFPFFFASFILINTYNMVAAIRISGLNLRFVPVIFLLFPYYLFTLGFFIYPLLLELNPLTRMRGHINIWEKTR